VTEVKKDLEMNAADQKADWEPFLFVGIQTFDCELRTKYLSR
jgi:hypothetical protein